MAKRTFKSPFGPIPVVKLKHAYTPAQIKGAMSTTAATFIGSLRDCAKELERRGFRYSHDGQGGDGKREYWKRTDGKPDVFQDHSATITKIGSKWAISDFLNRNGVK